MSIEQNKNKREPSKLSRREFLKDAGLVVGGTALGSLAFLNACSGATQTVTQTVAPQTVTNTATDLSTATVTDTVNSTLTTIAPSTTSAPTTTTAKTTTTAPTSRTITDMVGRAVVVPTTINRVLCCGPVEFELVYMLAPNLLVGAPFTWDGTTPLVPSQYANIPVVGGTFGTQTLNPETFIAAKPDIIIDGTSEGTTDISSVVNEFNPIPVIGLTEGDVTFSYKDAINFLGNLLGVQAQAAALIDYYTTAALYVSSIVSQIPASSRVNVYYAEGSNGLNTDPLGSQHTALLAACGGNNVAQVQLLPGYGMATVSMEQVFLWNPDVVIIGRGTETNLYNTIKSDPIWSQLNAVRGGKLYIRPDNPLSWMDGPPGPCQIVGMYWLVHLLYPAQTTGLALNSLVKQFYTNFLNYPITDTQVSQMLQNPSPLVS